MIGDPRHILAIADRMTFERGELDPLEFLVGIGALDESDYQDWLSGRRQELQPALQCDVRDAVHVLEQVREYLTRQGLTIDSSHGSNQRPAARGRIGSDATFVDLCTSRMVPASSQLDLFRDSALALAELSARTAIASRHIEAAEPALCRLASLGADTSGYRRLLDADIAPDWDVAQRLAQLEAEIAPLAVRCLGEQARTYLARLWESLASRMPTEQFDQSAPHLHASYALAKAALWPRVIEAIEKVPGWSSSPPLLGRLAEAHSHSGNREASRRIWSRLCWEHPLDAETMLPLATGDGLLGRRWREFIDLDPELPTEDFPAWLLIADLRQRELVPALCATPNEAGRAYGAMHSLLSRHDDISARRVLNEHNKTLLQHYLVRRRPDRIL